MLVQPIYYLYISDCRHPISAIVLTTLIVNSRMFLLSMTLTPTISNMDFGIGGLGTLLTDETFGVAITPYVKGLKN